MLNQSSKVLMRNYHSLVLELTKENPSEAQIKSLMDQLDLPYLEDSVDRLGLVFEKINQLRLKTENKKVKNDLLEHS